MRQGDFRGTCKIKADGLAFRGTKAQGFQRLGVSCRGMQIEELHLGGETRAGLEYINIGLQPYVSVSGFPTLQILDFHLVETQPLFLSGNLY